MTEPRQTWQSLRWQHLCIVMSLVTSILFASVVDAAKRRSAVVGNFSPTQSAAHVGDRVDLVLHLQALEPASQVEVQFVLPPQVRPVTGSAPWFGTLVQNATVDLPLTIEIIQEGEYSIGATMKAGRETGGATMNVVATGQGVQLSSDPIFLMKLRAAKSLVDRKNLLEGSPNPIPAPPPKPATSGEQKLNQFFLDQFRRQQESKAATAPQSLPRQAPSATTVSGIMHWLDSGGTLHPIRYALVQILDGATDTVLVETFTLADGTYSAGVNATSVKVRVVSEDGLRSFVRVYPPTDPTSRHMYTSSATPITSSSTAINITTDQPIRGTPGVPSVDAIQARAFSVFDAFMQYQVQAYGLRGAFMPRANVSFPNANSLSSPCPGDSCYFPFDHVLYILREDALDWDVMGHEFFHYMTDQGALRPIDNNPGGIHSGGSAIGQSPGFGSPPRNRDEGLRLAWSEGLATFMAVRLKANPASTAFGMSWPNLPCPLSSPCISHYQDSEDTDIDDDLENMTLTDGYGSENSVSAMLWLYTDPPPPSGTGQTGKFGFPAKFIWDLINTLLPCNPCDRVDRFWNAAVTMVGVQPLLVAVAQPLVLANIAPALSTPGDGSIVSGGVSPTFEWKANGDPSPNHNPNRFFLAFSKDNFQSDLHLLPANGQPIQATQYQIPLGDYQALVQGAASNTVFTWVVIGYRDADMDIRVPEGGGFWISNPRTFQVGP